MIGRHRDRLVGGNGRRGERQNQKTGPEETSHGGRLSNLQIDVLDHVAEVAGGIPEGLAAL